MRRPSSFVAIGVIVSLVLLSGIDPIQAELLYVVGPAADANTEADGGINRPNPQDRYQQVFSASDFQSLAAGRYAITQFAYRPNGEITTALQGTYESITVKLSTTSKAPGSLSMTFAENIGPDETIVLSAANFVVSTWNTGPVGGPKGFDMIHNFDTPFEYDPSQGNRPCKKSCVS